MVEIVAFDTTVPLIEGVFELLGEVGIEPVKTGADKLVERVVVVESSLPELQPTRPDISSALVLRNNKNLYVLKNLI